MGLYKTKGIVLKSIKLGEADRIVTFYSDSRGRIEAVAKGVRKVSSRFGSRLEPLSHLDLLIYEGRNLGTISQAEVITSFRRIREDLSKVLYGLAIADLIDKVSMAEEADRTIFGVLVEALDKLTELEKGHSLLLLAFDLRIVILLGYAPRFGVCVVCEREFLDRAAFSFKMGGTLCMNCRSADGTAAIMSAKAHSFLQRMSRDDYFGSLPARDVDDYPREVEGIVQRYMQYYLGTKLLSRKYLRKSMAGREGNY